MVFAPLWPHLEGVERLSIIPYGPLHDVPFYVLRDTASGVELIDRLTLSRAPSLRLWLAAEPPLPRPGARRLISAVHPRFKRHLRERDLEAWSNVAWLPPEDIEAETIASLVQPGDRVLLVTHGEFDEGRPWRSHIDMVTGEMTPRDVKREDWRGVELVFLASCEAARVHAESGDQVQGFPRAFQSAGVRNLIAPHWKVSAMASRVLLCKFLDAQSTRGLDAAEALRHAALEVRDSSKHPYYWTAYTLTRGAGR